MQLIKKWTRLHYACYFNYKKIIDFLLNNNANINAQDKHLLTPLHYSLWMEYDELSDYLINRGADINLPDYNGSTPLHYSCFDGLYKISKILLNKGADVNIQNNKGITPLYYACRRYDSFLLVKLLLTFNADPYLKTKEELFSLYIFRLCNPDSYYDFIMKEMEIWNCWYI